MRFFSTIILSVVLAVSPHVQGQSQIDEGEFNAGCSSFASKLEQSLAGTKIPGATAAFVMPDGRICKAAAGMTDKGNGRKLTPEDPIFAGSIGKTFVSAFALQLVEEGRLNLDQKIEHWLGSRSWFTRLPNAHDITVRMLMNHSSGIPNHVEEKRFYSASLKGADRDIAFDDLLTFILDKKPLFQAGKGHLYADTNYILLAMIEEDITKTTMYDEVTRRFLKPLHLDHTSPSNKNLDPAVHGFYDNTPVVKKGRLIINPQWEWAGGGFWSTPEDLARWARELYGGKVLTKPLLDQLFNSTTPDEGQTYGLGVEIVKTKWGISYGHDGEWPGYLSVMRYYPKFGVSVAIQYNAGGTREAEVYGQAMADDLAGIFAEDMTTDKLSADERQQIETLVLAWLRLVDAGKLAESWDTISAELKAKYTRAAWPAALKPLVSKTGTSKNRRVRSVVRTEANVVTIDFASAFSKLSAATEAVQLKLEDGQWRVLSYSIH